MNWWFALWSLCLIGPWARFVVIQGLRIRALGDEVESMLIASRALGVAFERCSELQPISLPWRSPLLHPLPSGEGRVGQFLGPLSTPGKSDTGPFFEGVCTWEGAL